MQISNTQIACFAIAAPCAVYNAYLAPKSFTVGFALGTCLGVAFGLKDRARLILTNAHEQILKAVKQNAPEQVTITADQTVKKVNELIGRVNPLVRKIVEICISYSPLRNIQYAAAAAVPNFDKQRSLIRQDLNPMPGISGAFVALVTLAANLNTVAYPVLSKIGLISGIAPGYDAGLLLANRINLGPRDIS